ncbi:MAG: hypothetical protein CSB55_07120 [Candidatus Cloacimonadota bacterium]|nr:MAG: hypothetical protein CSB55_07120 [Candidatus Cloacimonadota bacterium]
MYREAIIKKLDSIKEIPSLFNMAIKLEKLTADSKTTPVQVSDLIRLDPAMAMRVLRLANSALYAGNRRIVSLTNAVAKLGFSEIRRLTVSVAVINSFRNFYVDYDKFWRHSVSVAYLGLELLKRSNLEINHEKVYNAGLLHDIGVIILDHHFTAVYRKIFGIATERKSDLRLVENKILGISHAEVGALLMRKWNLPEDIADIIEFSDMPQKVNYNPGAGKIIYLADFICNNRGIDNGTGFFPESFYDDIWDELDLSIDDIPEILESVQKSVEKAKALIKIGGN